jgi:DNA ligase-associated metallophosphoesterase
MTPDQEHCATGDLCVTLADEAVVLMPERALWWPAQRTLIVADVHFGKSSVFRTYGLAVPGGSTDDNLARLSRCIERYGAERLLCLGDLTHARAGHTPRVLAKLADFRARHASLHIELVRGNHDRHAGVPGVLSATLVDEPLREGPFCFRHEPVEERDPQGGYVLAGHVHPAIVLSALHDRLRVPAFVFGVHAGILPAFGAFTGMHSLPLERGTRYYPALDDCVMGPLPG